LLVDSSKTIREMVELLCSRHPQAGYERRDLYTHRSRLTGVNNVKKILISVTFVYLFSITRTSVPVKSPVDHLAYSSILSRILFKYLCVRNLIPSEYGSLSRSLFNLRTSHLMESFVSWFLGIKKDPLRYVGVFEVLLSFTKHQE